MGCTTSKSSNKTSIQETQFQTKALNIIKSFKKIKSEAIELQSILYTKFNIKKIFCPIAAASDLEKNNAELHLQALVNEFEEKQVADTKVMKQYKIGGQNPSIFKSNPKYQKDQNEQETKKNDSDKENNIGKHDEQQRPSAEENTEEIFTNNILLKNNMQNMISNKTTAAVIQGTEELSPEINCDELLLSYAEIVKIDNFLIVSQIDEWNALKDANQKYLQGQNNPTKITDMCRLFLGKSDDMIIKLTDLHKQSDILSKCIKVYAKQIQNKTGSTLFQDLNTLTTNSNTMLKQFIFTKENLAQLSLMQIIANTSNSVSVRQQEQGI